MLHHFCSSDLLLQSLYRMGRDFYFSGVHFTAQFLFLI
jgi:hypothetical protein